jgi:hypothetical protein
MLSQLRYFLLPCIVFAGMFTAASLMNRVASDDFEFLSKLRDLGFTGSVAWFYNHWNTRWMAIGWMNLVFMWWNVTGALWVYHTLSMTMLWWVIRSIIRNKLNLPSTESSILAALSCINFFFLTFSISDVFFWINTSTMYLWGSIAFLFAFAEIIKERSWLNGFPSIIISALYLGGSYEPLVATSMAGSVVFLWMMFTRKGGGVVSQPAVLRTIVFLSVLMIAFAISFAGEGHVIRSSFLPDTSLQEKLWIGVKAVVKMFVVEIPMKLGWILVFMIPWMIVGTHQAPHWLKTNIFRKITITLTLLIIISLAPVVWVMSEMGPERAWTQITIWLTAFTAIAGMYVGKKLKNLITDFRFFPLTGRMVTLILLLAGLPQLKSSWNYMKAYDTRMEIFQSKKGEKGELIKLEPLPEPGWFHSAEIATYPEHFTNRHLKSYLQLETDPVLKTESEK